MADALGRNYKALGPHERFVLLLEAMARGDEAEADRLEESIAGDGYYRHREEYLRRMRIMYTITLMVCLNLRGKLAQIEAGRLFCEQYKLYVEGPALVTTCAFLYGRRRQIDAVASPPSMP